MCKIHNLPNRMHSSNIHYFSREPPWIGKWCHWDTRELEILSRFLLIRWASSPYPSQSINHMKCIKRICFLQIYMKCIMHMIYQTDTRNASKIHEMHSDQPIAWYALPRCYYMIYHSNTFSTRMDEVSPICFSKKVHEISLWYSTKMPFNKGIWYTTRIP